MIRMRIVVWVRPGTWAACVDAARAVLRDGDEVVLVDTAELDLAELASGAYRGLAGRDPGSLLAAEADRAAEELLAAAERRLDRPCHRRRLTGRPERAVTAAVADAGLLVLARDGDHARLGPRSIGPPTRFVLDHAPCRVLLVWPDEPPALSTLPPEPPR
jgi:nucleotide-binding universal stress UspA family protein